MRIFVGHVAGSRFQDIYPPAAQALCTSAQHLTEIVLFQKTVIAFFFLLFLLFEKSLLEHHNVDE